MTGPATLDLPDFLTQTSGIFSGKPTNYLTSLYGVATAFDLELAWDKMPAGCTFTHQVVEGPLLEWLPTIARRTFENAPHLQHVVPPYGSGVYKRKRVPGATAALKRRRFGDTCLSGDRIQQTCQISSSLHKLLPTSQSKSTNVHRSTASTSQFWSPTKQPSSPARTPVASVPFASLHSTSYGLIQEELAQDPFKVLVAVLFLVKTRGKTAIPTIRKILELYPTPESFAAAEPEDLFPDIKHLGFGNRRAEALIDIARAWIDNPPEKGKCYRRLNYPVNSNSRDISVSEQPLDDGSEDAHLAFEVCHLPHIAKYGIDSWRIFCRDVLRGVPHGLIAQPVFNCNNKEANAKAIKQELQQEWTRVIPTDKELRGYVKWRWLRLGWLWDAETGQMIKVRRKTLKKLQSGQLKEWEGFPNPWL